MVASAREVPGPEERHCARPIRNAARIGMSSMVGKRARGAPARRATIGEKDDDPARDERDRHRARTEEVRLDPAGASPVPTIAAGRKADEQLEKQRASARNAAERSPARSSPTRPR